MADGQRVPRSDPTLGQRLNNPFNLKDIGNQGFVGATGTEGEFLRFNDPLAGIRAADRTLNTYGRDYGINTLAALLDRWAPSSENPTEDYLAYVAEQSGFGPNQEIDLTNPYVRERILTPMGTFESRTDVTQDMIRRAREIGQPVSELASSTIAVERPTLMSGLAPSVLPSEDLGRGTGSQFTLASQLSGTPGEQQEQVGTVLRELLGETNVPFTRQFVNPDVYDPERQAEIERGLGARKDLQYLYGAVGPEQQRARAAEIASRFPVMALAGAVDDQPTVVSDPSESAAVKGDASKVVTGGSEAGDVPGARTEIDPATMDAALQSGDPDAKARQDAGAPRLGDDPTNIDPVAYARGRIPADMELEFPEEGPPQIKGERQGDRLFNRYLKTMFEQDDPTRSYKELLDLAEKRGSRDYSEGTAAAAAIRAESEAEQQRLKEEGRSAALSDALIALGAGIAGGDLAGGLSRAGQAATAARKEFETAARQERRYGTLEARAQEQAARAARSAAEMQELGIRGRQIEADYDAAVRKNQRELAIGKAFVDRADALGIRQDRAEELVIGAMETVSDNIAKLAREGQLTTRSLIGLKEKIVAAVPKLYKTDAESIAEWAKTVNAIYDDIASEYAGAGSRGPFIPELERALGRTIGER